MRLFAVLVALALSGCATAPVLASPRPGVARYHYELTETMPGQPGKAYRMDYDIEIGRDHGVVAVVRHASERVGDVWQDVHLDSDCAAALHARTDELARIRLWPLDAAVAQSMNADFMALCAPGALFYPMSDILNVVLVHAAPQFKLSTLHAAGDKARFDAYATQFERLGVAISVAAPGGEVQLETITPDTVTVLWASDPMNVRIIHRATASEPEVTLEGVENYAFRLQIDAHTGALRRAVTTADALDLTVLLPGLPPNAAPHLHITRAVTIARVP